MRRVSSESAAGLPHSASRRIDSSIRKQARTETALRSRIREIAQVRVGYGYRKIRVLLKREGWNVGKKLVIGCIEKKG